MTIRFERYQLRTVDIVKARGFYEAVLRGGCLDIVPLHEEALRRGARPHWLGHLGVDDVERLANEFAGRGATRLGPTHCLPNGSQLAVLKDPGGAVVALATRSLGEVRSDVLWQSLNTMALERTIACYCELLGWQLTEHLELKPLGIHHQFAWAPDGPSVGSIGDIAGRAGVHPHWLFHFGVESLELAMDTVREGGGLVLEPIVLPNGNRVAVCDDPQGAAFALMQARGGTEAI